MNKINYFLFQQKKSSNLGFTLIELLVTMIILGILSAVAIPTFTYQIGKSRESETKNFLGVIARGQQSYHWETQTFANDLQSLGLGGVGGASSKYHDVPNPTDVSNSRVKHQAVAIDGDKYQVRNFAIGVYYSSGFYRISLCQSIAVNDSVNVGDNYIDDCIGNAVKLK